MQLLEGDERAQQGAGLARFDPGREQKQQRVEIVLFRRRCGFRADIARRPAPGCRAPRKLPVARSKPGVSSGQLVRIGDREAWRDMGEAVPLRARRELPVARRWRRARRSATSSHGISRAPPRPRPARLHAVRHEGVEKPAARGIFFLAPRIRGGPRAASCAVRCRAGWCRPTARRPSGPSSSARRRRARRTADRTARSRREQEGFVEAAMLDVALAGRGCGCPSRGFARPAKSSRAACGSTASR